MKQKKEFVLEGLSCAYCATKIEDEVGKLPEVAQANLNLVNNKLSIAMNDNITTDLSEVVNQIVATHEPKVKVRSVSDHAEIAEKSETDIGTKLYILRLGIAVILTVLFSLLKVSDRVGGLVFLFAYLLVGYEVLFTAGKNIWKGKVFDENFLMGIASLGAFVIGEQEEAVAVLVFYGIGELLQDRAVHKSRKNITGLMDIRPEYANIKKGTSITVVSPELVQVGDIILVKPGERIPLDGLVVKGNSYIDTRALTGESVPVEVKKNDLIYSGTVNTSGVIEIEVTKPYSEATVSKILELVQNASSKKAKSEKFITRFARYYTPIVVLLAVAVAVFPPLFGAGPFETWLYRALSFLIISCPCALVISIPLSFFGGIGGGAKQGILIKGGNYLDALKRVDTIVFDKTGTLTKGVFEVSKVCSEKGVKKDELMKLAAIAESHSTHPIAKSIRSYYKKDMSDQLVEAQFIELAGHGVVAELSDMNILAGNVKLMHQYDIPVTEPTVTGSIVYIAKNNKYMGYILISDEIKSGVKETMNTLKQIGVKRTVMLTGDQDSRAKEVAQLCQVDEYKAELLPQDKVAWFEKYKKQMVGNGKIVFVGDGINDAPVLAGADIGIAMGGIGSDAAIEAADVVIMNDDIEQIATAVKLARKTGIIVMQNIVFALGIKALIMVLAFLGITSIWFAIFADVGVALLALLNAMRVMNFK